MPGIVRSPVSARLGCTAEASHAPQVGRADVTYTGARAEILRMK
jgi:hypothetical protein